MYDDLTDDQLRDRLALVEQQRRIAVEQLDSARSELRLERQRVADLEAQLALERARAGRGRRCLPFW